MDRVIVYAGALPQDTDILSVERNTMVALGAHMQAALGTSTVVDGLACTQTTVPSFQVQVGPGSILTYTTLDATAFGSLASDTTDSIVKMGINVSTTTMSALTAPGTAGQSQNWLLEAQFSETDSASVVLPYYNAGNPSQPYSGAGNSGVPQNTKRAQTVALQWKPGTAATTGTQTTPAPDSGWVGLWVITIANGQASITNANIAQYSAAPFIRAKVPSILPPSSTLGGVSAVQIYAGNPNGHVAGTTQTTSVPADMCFDTTTNGTWICTSTGTTSTAVWAPLNPGRYTFTSGSPPSSDISLNVGDKVIQTFSGIASIPMKVATSQGIYRVTVVETADNTTDSNWQWNPNNTTYTGAFSSYNIEPTTGQLSGLGNATTPAAFTTSTVSPWIGVIPTANANLSQNNFTIDLIGGAGPNVDVGPCVMEFLASTFTLNKTLRAIGGVKGGPSLNYSLWNDTTTTWTSLGTLISLSGTSASGTIVVERVA